MCGLVKVRSKEDPFVSDMRFEPVAHEGCEALNGIVGVATAPRNTPANRRQAPVGSNPPWMNARPENSADQCTRGAIEISYATNTTGKSDKGLAGVN